MSLFSKLPSRQSANLHTKCTFRIAGMHCASCATMIDLDIEDLPGVKCSKTNYAKQITEVEFDSSQVLLETLKDTIAKAGYDVVD